MTKVSVILPVYGVAQYIEKCVDSLLNQTLEEMQFIFVDDHGPDNSIELAKKRIEGHPRQGQFLFLKPEHNLGAGMARNYGIPYAEGQYIAFVDSDDWIDPDMFEKLYSEAVANGETDVCYCQIRKDFVDGRPSQTVSNPQVKAGILSEDEKRFFLTHYVSLFSTYIYRRDMIVQNEIHFPESRSADDSFFVTSALIFAKSMAHVDQPLYHYILRPGSVTTTKDSTKYKKRLATFDTLISFLKRKDAYNKYKNEIDYIYIKKGYFSSVFNYLSNSSEPKRSTIKEIRSEMQRLIPDYAGNIYYRKKMSLRMLDWLLRCMPGVAMKIVPVYVRKTGQVV